MSAAQTKEKKKQADVDLLSHVDSRTTSMWGRGAAESQAEQPQPDLSSS